MKTTNFLILLSLISSMKVLANPEIISAKVKVTREVQHLGRLWVQNDIEVKMSSRDLVGLEARFYPRSCPGTISPEHEKFAIRLVDNSEISTLSALALFDISGNNGYADFDVYLCLYYKADADFALRHLVGQGEYFIND